MIIRNNISAFLWCFSAVFMLFVGAMTFVFLRDGAPQGYSPSFIYFMLILFWVGGLALTVYAAGKYCIAVTIQGDGRVLIVKSYPFKKEERTVFRSELTPATIHESTDDEGSPYFRARVMLRDGSSFDIAEGHHKKSCESACADFNQLVWNGDTGTIA